VVDQLSFLTRQSAVFGVVIRNHHAAAAAAAACSAIVDEVLPPAFLASCLPSLPDGGLGITVVQATGAARVLMLAVTAAESIHLRCGEDLCVVIAHYCCKGAWASYSRQHVRLCCMALALWLR
jgi:hypothetical protein